MARLASEIVCVKRDEETHGLRVLFGGVNGEGRGETGGLLKAEGGGRRAAWIWSQHTMA